MTGSTGSTGSVCTFFAEWPSAERAGDATRLGPLLTDDFVATGPLGFLLSRPAWLARHGQGLQYEAFEVQELQVRTYRDVAIVIGRHVQQGTFAGNPIPTVLQATHVLVGDRDRWRLAALHMSFVAGTPGAPTPSP